MTASSDPPSWPWRKPLTGHCFCRASSYTLNPTLPLPSQLLRTMTTAWGQPYFTFFDHCGSCRRSTSSLFTAWLILPTCWLTFTPSSPVKTYTTTSGNVRRTFCGECGTSFTYWARDRAEKVDVVDVTVASLCEEDLQSLPEILGCNEGEERIMRDHMWWDEGIRWVQRDIFFQRGRRKVSAYRDGYLRESSKVDFSAQVEEREIKEVDEDGD